MAAISGVRHQLGRLGHRLAMTPERTKVLRVLDRSETPRRSGLSVTWWGLPGVVFFVGGVVAIIRGSYGWGVATALIGASLLRSAIRRYRAGFPL